MVQASILRRLATLRYLTFLLPKLWLKPVKTLISIFILVLLHQATHFTQGKSVTIRTLVTYQSRYKVAGVLVNRTRQEIPNVDHGEIERKSVAVVLEAAKVLLAK